MTILRRIRKDRILSRFSIIFIFSFFLISVLTGSFEQPLLPEAQGTLFDDSIGYRINNPQNYTYHSSINILGNNEFHSQAVSEGWPGNGTQTNPYIITNYFFNGTDPMFSIRETQLSFLLTRCLFNGEGDTISLMNVENGTIEENIIGNSTDHGIIMDRCQKVTVTNNIIQFSQISGIYLFLSHYNTIKNNTILNSGENGISLSFSDSNHFSRNEIIGNGQNGIEDMGNSDANVFVNNVVTESIYGLRIRMSDSNQVLNNSFCLNDFYGVDIDDSDYTLVHWNNFIFNHQERTFSSYSQASDSGWGDDSTNEFSFNYWSDWNYPDNNSDGFIDLPYILEGYNEQNNDSFPLSLPNNFSRDLVTKPRVTHPSSGDIVRSQIFVDWVDSKDWFDYNLFYSLSYCQDDGDNWILIESDISISLYLWDTYTLPDGSYRLRVIAYCPDTLSQNSDDSGPFRIENAVVVDTTINLTDSTTSPLQNSTSILGGIFPPLLNLNSAALFLFLVILFFLVLSSKRRKN